MLNRHQTHGQIREAVGIFQNQNALNDAVAELENTAFPRHDISVLGSPADIEDKFGGQSIAPELLEDNPKAPRDILTRPEERTIAAAAFIGCAAYVGGVVTTIEWGGRTTIELFAALATGSLLAGIVASLIVFILAQRYRNRTRRQIDIGGLLLWVRTPGPNREKLAKDIMRKYGAKHVHIHDIE